VQKPQKVKRLCTVASPKLPYLI